MTPSKKLYILETAWSYKLKFSGLSSFYDTNNWGKFKENLRRKGVKVWMIWHGTTPISNSLSDSVLTSSHFRHLNILQWPPTSSPMPMVNQKKTYTPIPKGATAPCWKLAIIDPSNPDYALCKVPECPYSRFSRGGGKGAKYSTQM